MRRKDKKSTSPVHNNVSIEIQKPVDVSGYVLWRKPLATLYYAVVELFCVIGEFCSHLAGLMSVKRFVTTVILVGTLIFLNQTPGSHQQVFLLLRKNIWWSLYWLGLGFLSSVGFGFGLHTFVLYLAPHLINVTLAAYECQSVDFIDHLYPDRLVCPEETGVVTIWTIFHKIFLEAFMWGAGTAVGELPPYFVARACRLSGKVDEEEAEMEELRRRDASELAFKDKCKIFIQDLVNKIGFLGILLCASVPNPLYDLAGVTCGHFLIPFWTFFGATLIGKALIKMSIQTLFVIFVFSEHHFKAGIKLIKSIPTIGAIAGPAFENFLEKQKHKLRHPEDKDSILSLVFNSVLVTILICFAVSVVNMLAQRRARKLLTKDAEAKK